MTLRDALPLGIFALAYLVLARGNLPPLRLDRAGAALVGAVAMVVSGAVSPEEAQAAISFPTLMLLLGMMIVVANLRLSGAFTVGARLGLARAPTPPGPPRRPPPPPAPATPAPPALAAPLEVGRGLARRTGGLRRRLPDAPRGPRRGRRPSPHPARQARAHLRRHRLDHAPHVRRAVRGRARPRSDGAAGGRAAHPRPRPPRAPAGPGGGHGRALERRQQRPCRAALPPARAAPRAAARGGPPPRQREHAGGESHAAPIGPEPDRRRACAAPGGGRGLARPPEGRRARDRAHAPARPRAAPAARG